MKKWKNQDGRKNIWLFFSDGERIVATGAMCDLMCIGFHEAATSLNMAAVSMNDRQCKKMADVFQRKSNEIYTQLNSFGFYDGIMGELIKKWP